MITLKKILISSFDMAVGGVERSLISLLESFDYEKYDVDLLLYRQQGEFMSMLPKGPKLLKEIPGCAAFRKSILEVTKEGHYGLALARLAAKYAGNFLSVRNKFKELGLVAMQLGWKYSLYFLPQMKERYDVAISYLWPHYFVGEKVHAGKKIAWVHTDYSYLEIDNRMDAEMWNRFDWIVTVSEACRESFLKKYPQFKKRTMVIENLASAGFIQKMAEEDTTDLKENGTIRIVTVARLAFAKGIDDAAKACRRLLDEGYKITWYIVGYGNEEENIRKLINELKLKNHFILLGMKINPYPYVKNCDIYVQPSRYEGKAVTVTEAQILGKPVLLTNYNTAKSQVSDGYDGIITDSGAEGIALGVKRLIDYPELRKMLQRNTANSNYSNHHEIHKLYSLFES